MKLGMVLPQQEMGTDPANAIRWAQTVEALGFGYIDIFDHVLGADISDRDGWPGPYTYEHEFHEVMVMLGFLAGHVNLELATGVLVLPQRPTALVAKQAAQVDLLSQGRFRLGVGIGWNPVEYESLGTTFADRARRYEEQISVLRQLWTQQVVDIDTDVHRIDRAGIAPLPVQRPIPIWMGGGHHQRVLERIGRLGDGWIAHLSKPGPEVNASMEVIRSAATAAGRDAQSIGLQGRIDIFGPLDADRVRSAAQGWAQCGATHLSVHAHSQGTVNEHLVLLPTLAEALGEFLAP